jgi:hypothetical protein
MTKKKQTTDPIETPIEATPIEETTLEATVQPVASIVETANIRPGYVQLQHKENKGVVIVNAKHVGTVYSTDIWEPLTDEKKS